METVKGAVTNTIRNKREWSIYTKPLLNKVLQTSDTNISVQDSLNFKVEIEQKDEEESEFVYQPDFYGHLRLVSLNHDPNCCAIESLSEWNCMQPSSDTKEANIVPTILQKRFNNDCVYGQLKNVSYDMSDDMEEKLPKVYNFPFESTLQQLSPKSNQVCRKRRNRQHPIILAEKKREYRMRIKEENPSMWCAMKQKEACKKREQREEKRLIILEMQKMMELISISNSSEVENHKLYLESLKQRYPEIWKQLIDALSATEQRNQEFKNEKNSERPLSKPLEMYKDVVEAQKKYLYRKKMKLERPELYEQQKARDSYAKSIRRMLKKKLSETQNNIND